METQQHLSEEVAKLKSENATLQRRIQTLLLELERMRRKLESTWGEA